MKKLKEENKTDLYEESHKNDVTTSPKGVDESTPSDSALETKGDVDVESTQSSGDMTSASNKSTQIQNEGSTIKNAEENKGSSQDPGVTGAM